MVGQNVLDAFQMMWGQFPEPVMLLHKSRTILAVNDVARTAGVPLGVKCSSLNPANEGDHHCRQCKATQALRAKAPVVETSQIGERHVKGYWIPLKDFEDVYVHFGVTITEDINAALSANRTV